MKMTSWGCYVLVYDSSGEPLVHPNDPGLPQTDLSATEFEFGSPTSEEEVDKKKIRTKRVPKSPLTAVLDSWLLSIPHCRFLVISIVHFPSCLQVMPKQFLKVSGKDYVSTGVETDGKLRGRHIVVIRSLVPLAGGSSMISLSLSTVDVGAGSCWNRRLMMVIFVFKWRIY